MHGIAGWRRVVLWPLVALLRLWGRTLRVEVAPEDRAFLEPRADPVIFVLWHNRLFAVPEIFRRYFPTKRIYALISASKDGAWLSAFFEMAGLGTVRGSSSNYGREALHAMVERLDAGDDVGLTPDGPRGPCYKLKPGGIILARKSDARTVLLGIDFDRAWRIPSWDRFYLPMPWSTVRVSFGIRTADELRVDGDVASRMEADLIRMNPDSLAPRGTLEKTRPRVV